MTMTLAEIVNISLGSLADKYSLRPRNEVNDGDAYSVEYENKQFVVRLDKYGTEIYTSLYKASNPDIRIDLFNLLAYLALPQTDAPVSEFFHNEMNIEERCRKQVDHVATVLDRYYEAIDAFFRTRDYVSKVAEADNFVVSKHPELFKTRAK